MKKWPSTTCPYLRPIRNPLILIVLVAAATANERYSVSTSRAAGDVALLVLRDAAAKVEAAVAPSKGGELSSLVIERQGTPIELIYLARDYTPRSGFAGKAMFLWPATGPVVGNRWTVGGQGYSMPFHGFAKEQAWDVVEHSASAAGARAVLRIRDSAATRESYPFGFVLTVTYELAGGGLTIRYDVSAAAENTSAMPFAIGNHVAFNLPPSGQGSAGNVMLETNCRDEIVRDAASLPTGVVQSWRGMPSLALADVRAVPAISLANCGKRARVGLRDPAGVTIEVTHEPDRLPKMPVVQFNLYGTAKDGYFSPEPWVGLQGGLNSGKGLTQVAPGQSWRWTIRVKATQRPPAGKRP